MSQRVPSVDVFRAALTSIHPFQADLTQYIQLDRHQAVKNACIRFSILLLGAPLTHLSFTTDLMVRWQTISTRVLSAMPLADFNDCVEYFGLICWHTVADAASVGLFISRLALATVVRSAITVRQGKWRCENY